MSAISPPRGRSRRFDAAALALAEAFWPGPLTLVLPKADGCAVADLATAGLDTVAIRIPAHPVARDILRAVRPPGGGAVGQSVRSRLADHGRPCRQRPFGADRPDRRRRPGRGRRRIDHCRLLRAADAAAARRPAARRDRARARPGAAAAARRRRQRQRTTAGAGHAGLALRAARARSGSCRARSSPARHCSRSASEQFRELTPLPQ